jgi:hypothetical protein
MARPKWVEGDWIGVPVRGGGWSVGVIARLAGRGKTPLGYFFGPRLDALPGLDHVAGLRPEDAVFVGLFGSQGLRRGSWPVLGRVPGWDRAEWPVPVFTVKDAIIDGLYWRRFYDPDDPGRWLSEERVERGVVPELLSDSLSGSGAVEIWLSKLLPGGVEEAGSMVEAAGSAADDSTDADAVDDVGPDDGGWVFEGDAAMDFMAGLVAGGDVAGSLVEVFDRVLEDDGYLEVDSGEAVVVSAAVLDSVLNGTVYGYGVFLRSGEDGPDVSDGDVYSRWVASLEFEDAAGLAVRAVKALSRVVGDGSELAELQDDAGDGVWRGRVGELVARLSRSTPDGDGREPLAG